MYHLSHKMLRVTSLLENGLTNSSACSENVVHPTKAKSQSLPVESVKSPKAERAYRARPVVGAVKRATWFARDVSRGESHERLTVHRREYSSA